MSTLLAKTQRLLDLLGHGEMPLGVTYSPTKPADGYGPKAGEILSREREAAGEIDWAGSRENFSCLIGNIWLARKKRKPAWIGREECGCAGGGYFSGMYAPYLERTVYHVSVGVPGSPAEGEFYMPSPEAMRAYLEDCALPPPGLPGEREYCVIKALEFFGEQEHPLVVVFFAKPEALTGLFSLACFATGDHNAVRSPFGSGCASIIAWPQIYQRRGMECAVLGGFDPSARKFMALDELSLAVPFSMYGKMLDSLEDSALTRGTWSGVRKRVAKSEA